MSYGCKKTMKTLTSVKNTTISDINNEENQIYDVKNDYYDFEDSNEE